MDNNAFVVCVIFLSMSGCITCKVVDSDQKRRLDRICLEEIKQDKITPTCREILGGSK